MYQLTNKQGDIESYIFSLIFFWRYFDEKQ